MSSSAHNIVHLLTILQKICKQETHLVEYLQKEACVVGGGHGVLNAP